MVVTTRVILPGVTVAVADAGRRQCSNEYCRPIHPCLGCSGFPSSYLIRPARSARSKSLPLCQPCNIRLVAHNVRQPMICPSLVTSEGLELPMRPSRQDEVDATQGGIRGPTCRNDR